MARSEASGQGMELISILSNTIFFGLVSQQFYAYCIIGFKDPIRLRLFVVVQFLLVSFQSLLMWHLAWYNFVVQPSRSPPMGGFPQPGPPPLWPWEGPINALCQPVIILMANTFLALRIYNLTKCRVQCGVVIALSVIAFVLGMVTNVKCLKTLLCGFSFPAVETRISVAWHAVQAVTESLITFFLSRVLLRCRSGDRTIDSTVNYIVRGIIQTGCLATAWAIVALATWFLLPYTLVYKIFDVTSGMVYTHAIFETLLSRIRLRERLESQSWSEPQESWREPSNILEGLRVTVSKVYDHSPTPARASVFEPESTPSSKNEVTELENRAVE